MRHIGDTPKYVPFVITWYCSQLLRTGKAVSETVLNSWCSTLVQGMPHSGHHLSDPQMCEDPTLLLYLYQMASMTHNSTWPKLHVTVRAVAIKHRFTYRSPLLRSSSWLPVAYRMKFSSYVRPSRPSSSVQPWLPPLRPTQVHMSSLCPVPLEPWLASHSWMKS